MKKNSCFSINRKKLKVFLIMKITFTIIILSINLSWAASGYSQTDQLSIDVKQKSVREVFSTLEKASGYRFFYNDNFNYLDKMVNINAKNQNIHQILNAIFDKTDFEYKILENKLVVVSIKEELLQAKNKIVGKVTDESGALMAGVTVSIKGTTKAVVTNEYGIYSISITEKDKVLVFTFIGMKKQEVTIGGRSNINVVLESEASKLNEVVVVGYGTKLKKDLTGSISSINSKDLQKFASSNFTSALEGKVAGVIITQTGGAPGGATSVRMRGIGTTGENRPLYVIDGVPMDGGGLSIPNSSYQVDGLSSVNSNDIESVEILKDAAASAIYGSRAANGVIIITTKRGKEGKLNVDFNAYTGFSQLWKTPEFLNATEFATMANELYTNSGLTPNPEWANPSSFGKGTNMVDKIFRNAQLQNYDFSVSGGNKNLKARLSLGYNDQDGTMIETSYKRYTGRATVDLKASDKFNFGGSISFASTKSKGQNTNSMQGGIFNLAQQFFPTLGAESAFYGDALYYTKDGDNPILKANSIDNELYNTRVIGNIFGEYEIIPNLKFKTSVGIDASFNRTYAWEGKIERGYYIHPQASLSENFSNSSVWLIENTLSYSKKIDSHSFSIVLGQTAQKGKNNWISSTGQNYLNETLKVINASDVSLRTTNGTGSNSALASYFGRIDYSYDSKYLISTSLRRDGSSNFGTNNKWGYFPAASLGWRLSKEPFMSSYTDVISDIKIRGSWGRVGNDNITSFGYLSTIRSGTDADNYVFGANQSIIIGSTMVRPGNPDLKWETTEQTNIGVDGSLYNDKIYFTADYYFKNTIGMLISLPVSLEAGFQNAPIVNGGKVQNRGMELLLGYRGSFNDFRFDISGNMSTLKNEVKSLGVGQPIVGPTVASMPMTYTEVGQPIGYFRGYIVDGIYQTNAEVNKVLQPNAIAGDFKYRDVNNDGVLTDADKVKLGSPWPNFTYGLNLNLSYKRFDLNVVVQGIAGNQIFDVNKVSNYQMKYFNGNGIVNGVRDILNHWTPGSGINDQPGLKYIDANGNYSNASSFFVEDGDYMRIRNFVLGYNIPSESIGKAMTKVFKSFRVYVSVQNLFTFTHYSGFDPEVGSTNPLNSGIDTGIYPQPRTFMAGINVNF